MILFSLSLDYFIQLKELEELLSQYKHLYPINSKHFTKSTLTSKCTLKKFRKQNKLDKNDLIFLEYKFKPTDVQIRDVILQYKVSSCIQILSRHSCMHHYTTISYYYLVIV